jgi:uncharacterized membrane protein
MAIQNNDANDRKRTPDEKSFNQAPKIFSKATLAVIAVGIVLLIIASLLISGFFSSPAG